MTQKQVASRDPRVNPIPGDVLRKGGWDVTIAEAGKHNFGYTASGIGGSVPPMLEWHKTWRPVWRKWAKDAEIIRRAEEATA